jgi:uncharacterized membrane protein
LTVKQILLSVFPPPRTPVTFRRALPLVVFLILYLVLCVGLEWTERLLFARPTAFALLVVTVWIWWMHLGGSSGLSRFRGLLALSVRLTLAGLFVMLLAEPRAVRTRDVLSVIYAVDVSDSIGETSTDRALEFVTKTVFAKPPNDEAGLVIFGRNSAVELPPLTVFPFEGDQVALSSRIDRDATNLEQALSLSAAMLPEENRGRIVLISDGTETAGNLSQILDELKSREIAVDVLPMQYDYSHEVWLERLDLPQFVKLGENYEAVVVLSALEAGAGKLVLRENGEVISEEPVEFQAGKNRYSIPIYLRTPGYYEYSASIELPRGKDELRQNNSVLNYIFVEGEGKVLIVRSTQGDERAWQFLAKTIREGKRIVDVQPAFDFPGNSLSLMPYDCVIFANVAADEFDAVQLQAVRDAVYNMGIGFMMVGGPNSFGPGGYHRTVVEEALPVSMDITQKKVLPKGALVIILHTCEFPEGNTWAKRITKQAINVLGEQDEVGVIAYTPAGEDWIFKLTPAGEYQELFKKINAAVIGDMPSFTNTMQLGLKGLQKSDASAKHMIIISDGDPSPPPPPLISDFQKSMVSISMVAIFPHGGQDISKMQAIAAVTGGRYYFPKDPNQLPAIFIKESKTLKRTMIQNRTITPEVSFPSPILRGIGDLPPLHGFVLTTPKPRAETILRVPPEAEKESDLDPVLVTWQYGLGRTAAFTSDLSPNWGADWMEWEQNRAFLTQLLTNVSRVKKEGHLRLWSEASGSEATIIAEDFHPEETFLEIQARISGPRDQAQTVPLKQISPRRYQARVPLWGKGRYQVMAIGVAGERKDHAYGGFIVPYSPEYLRFRSNPIVLKEIARRTGGLELTSETGADVLYGRRQPKQSSHPVFDWFLIALTCLIPLDVAVRRIQLDMYVIKNWLRFGVQKGPSGKTLGTLLARKQTVAGQLDARRDQGGPLPPPRRQPTPPKTSVLPAKPDAGQPAKTDEPTKPVEEPGSTTGRLLELKRRREQGKPSEDR